MATSDEIENLIDAQYSQLGDFEIDAFNQGLRGDLYYPNPRVLQAYRKGLDILLMKTGMDHVISAEQIVQGCLPEHNAFQKGFFDENNYVTAVAFHKEGTERPQFNYDLDNYSYLLGGLLGVQTYIRLWQNQPNNSRIVEDLYFQRKALYAQLPLALTRLEYPNSQPALTGMEQALTDGSPEDARMYLQEFRSKFDPVPEGFSRDAPAECDRTFGGLIADVIREKDVDTTIHDLRIMLLRDMLSRSPENIDFTLGSIEQLRTMGSISYESTA